MTSVAENDMSEVVRTLRIAAQGRREYSRTSIQHSPLWDVLMAEADTFDKAATLIEGGISRVELLRNEIPSWRWPEHGVQLEAVDG